MQRVSVVIRTRDIENRLNELLLRLSLQTLRPSEIVAVDNFSSHERLAQMKEFLCMAKTSIFGNEIEVKLVQLPDKEFSHAYSTNAGVYVARSDLVCITNGHSLPLSAAWLEHGTSHFRDAKVAAVGGYSTPHRDGTIWEKLTYGWLWRRFNEASGLYARDSYFSTTNCILRKTLWEEYPFDERLSDEIQTPRSLGGEDYDWAREMLVRKHRIVVEPRFSICHSHGEGPSILLSKYIGWHKVRKRVGQLQRPRESFTRLASTRPQCHTI